MRCGICGYTEGHGSMCDFVNLVSNSHTQTDEEYFEEQIGNGTREDIEAFFYNEECGDR